MSEKEGEKGALSFTCACSSWTIHAAGVFLKLDSVFWSCVLGVAVAVEARISCLHGARGAVIIPKSRQSAQQFSFFRQNSAQSAGAGDRGFDPLLQLSCMCRIDVLCVLPRSVTRHACCGATTLVRSSSSSHRRRRKSKEK